MSSTGSGAVKRSRQWVRVTGFKFVFGFVLVGVGVGSWYVGDGFRRTRYGDGDVVLFVGAVADFLAGGALEALLHYEAKCLDRILGRRMR